MAVRIQRLDGLTESKVNHEDEDLIWINEFSWWLFLTITNLTVEKKRFALLIKAIKERNKEREKEEDGS